MDGPLRSDFEAIGKTFILSELTRPHSYRSRIKKKIRNTTLNDEYKKVAARLAKNAYDLVYGNTIVSLPLLTIFKEDHSVKTICCIHELAYATGHFFSDAYIEANLRLADKIIAVSQAVKAYLEKSFKVPPEKVKLRYEFIDTELLSQIHPLPSRLPEIKQGQFVIGTGGSPSWRKGTDLVIPLALKLVELFPGFDFKIVWLGAGADDEWTKLLMYDAVKCRIDDKLLFISNMPDPGNHMALFDVFVLLSREDPFPLIVLEAAFLKKPVVAFENSGGIPEFIIQGAGLLAPYLNIAELAVQIFQLSKDKEAAKKFGLTGKRLVTTKYNTAAVAPTIFKQIEEVISQP